MEENTKSRKKLWPVLALVAVLAVAAVFAVPIISAIAKYNAGDYEAAAPTLKKYGFLQDKYLDSAEKLGDSSLPPRTMSRPSSGIPSWARTPPR